MIFIGADHRGWKVKEKIKEWLEKNEIDFVDLGASEYDKEDDYPDYSFKVGESVALRKGKGIVICGSGIGACVAANKVEGIRAGLCLIDKQVRTGRRDDDINVLVLSADLVSEDDNVGMVKVFLEEVFGSEERYVRRINKIRDYEKNA